MNLLVTGGAGFIGSNFIRYWFNKYPKDNIRNLDKLTYAGNLASTKDFSKTSNYEFVKADILDRKAVEKAMKNIDLVVHFAAESHVDRSIKDSSVFVKTNVEGTYVLLEEARKQKIKHFHHISTDEVFGSLPLQSNEQFNEDTKYNPRNPYSASKAGSDHLVRSYFYTHNLPITITNCSNNFGPYQYPEKFIPTTIINLLKGKKVPVYGDGKNVRDWLYVDDHASAIEVVVRKGKIGETYLVGGMNEDIKNIDIVRKIISLMNKSSDLIEFVKDRPGHDRRYSVDWSKINKELGWKPKHQLDEYLQKTIDWYIENEWWWKSISS